MFKIIYGVFTQETNTFSPLICKRENFMANGICFGDEVIERHYGKTDASAGMLEILKDAEDVEVIPTASYRAQSYGRVDQAICEEFIEIVLKTIRENAPVDGVFLSLHGGMSLTEDDDGIGLILDKVRKEVGPDVVMAASTDLHANITRKVIRNLDILTGFHEYPHTDVYETGRRAAVLGMDILRTGVRPCMTSVKIPMILQAEASTTKSGPLKELISYAEGVQESGEILDFSIYHMQPWMDIEEAGACAVVIAKDPKKAHQYAMDFAKRGTGSCDRSQDRRSRRSF